MDNKKDFANLEFDRPSNATHHKCQSFRDGEWIIHKCPDCDYEMRDNWRTGELKIKNAKPDINHSGSYFPFEYLQAFTDQN